MRRFADRLTMLLTCAVAATLAGGCGTLTGAVRANDANLPPDRPAIEAPSHDDRLTQTEDVVVAAADLPGAAAAFEIPAASWSLDGTARQTISAGTVRGGDATAAADTVAQARDADQKSDDLEAPEAEEYDPWEKFNEKMFEFNRRLDRYVLKPVAKVYNKIMPEPFQVLISNGFDNIAFVPRMINSALQGKWGGAGRELSRFLINSTAGIGGLFDPARDYWGIRKSREDFGQTLGVWGAAPGPYVIVPFLEPLTVRDGIGKFVDLWLDPSAYFLPLIWTRLGLKVGEVVNDRSLNLDLFQGFEESVIDLYSAVRHGYLQRREHLIKE